MKSIEIYLDRKRQLVNQALDRYLPSDKGAHSDIHKAMRYSVLNGGKRLRAILALMTGELLGVPNSRIMPFACSLELVHAYSLVHDDLPAMDNDDFRRGKPTCHKVFGEAMAILTGDALLTYAFQLVAEKTKDREVIPSLIVELSRAAGSQGMVGGQVLDIQVNPTSQVHQHNPGVSITEGQIRNPTSPQAVPLIGKSAIQNLEELHLMKTGAMIVVSARGAAIISGVDKKELTAITAYARNFGLAFQVVDDILDVSGSKANLGKTPGKDAKLNKLTYVSLMGLEQSRKEAERLINHAKKSLQMFGTKAQRLNYLADYILIRNG